MPRRESVCDWWNGVHRVARGEAPARPWRRRGGARALAGEGGGTRRRGGSGRPRRRRRHPARHGGLPGRLPHRRRLPRWDGGVEARVDARLERARHGTRARRGRGRGGRPHRLRLHDQHLREHERPDGRRELRARRGGWLRLNLRRDQVPRAQAGRGASGAGRPGRDRAARVRLRAWRPRARRADDRAGEHGQDAGEGVPRARAQHGARGRRGGRHPARVRQGNARRVLRARR